MKVLLGFTACVLLVVVEGRDVTKAQEDAARAACLSVIDERIADFTRTIFHDCVGGCNGCLDLSNPSNAGLAEYVDVLESLYHGFGIDAMMSRADFWATCGVVAVEEGHRRSPYNDLFPKINLRFGREDCGDNPNTPANNSFPNAHHGLRDTTTFFLFAFGLSNEETIALLGAHTLGEAKVVNSGFRGPWVPNEKSLDNDYYKRLVYQKWTQVNAGTEANPRNQWVDESNSLMMLNSDMCLAKFIRPASDGKEYRNFDEIPEAKLFNVTKSYADDNALWLADFSKVYEKMIHFVPHPENLKPAVDDAAVDDAAEEAVEQTTVQEAANPTTHLVNQEPIAAQGWKNY